MVDLAPKQFLSPNFGERRDGVSASIIVLHYTAMENVCSALERLCAPEFEVSCHYLIARDGDLFQLVDEEKRAWHAGKGAWGAITDVNSHSIGIEIDNDGEAPFSAPAMDCLEKLLKDILRRRNIAIENVIGHQDCANGRKIDPGPHFDWARLEYSGLAKKNRATPSSSQI